jgi:tRNA-splicing ligase RtcB
VFRKIADFEFEIPIDTEQGMLVPGLIFTDESMLPSIEKDRSFQQVINVAKLPGIVGKSLAMPDIHSGYGFPIGGVAAFDSDEGLISPGGVGYDINCGVSILATELVFSDIRGKVKAIVDRIFDMVPSGLGHKGLIQLDKTQMDRIMSQGIQWAIEHGYGMPEDASRTESEGRMNTEASPRVSNAAIQRGKNQLGSLGAGNHFLEIQRVDQIYDSGVAKKFGIVEEDQICIMIHTGSRGFGHQVATDYIKSISLAMGNDLLRLHDRQLAFSHIKDRSAVDYLGAMNAAANFAFCNREVIASMVRNAFHRETGVSTDSIRLVYSIAHNIAKVEEHEVEGKRMKLIVHRKGATRAMPPGRTENGTEFSSTGHPVLVPGDMGTASFIMVGDVRNATKSFCSSSHGAGRMMSRKASSETFNENTVKRSLESKGIYLRASTRNAVIEEAPGSYKNIDTVAGITAGAGLARKVVRLSPIGVVKG